MPRPRVGPGDRANPGLNDAIPSGLKDGPWRPTEEQAVFIPLKTAEDHKRCRKAVLPNPLEFKKETLSKKAPLFGFGERHVIISDTFLASFGSPAFQLDPIDLQ